MLADQAGVGGIPRSQTIWVGGIPEGDCTSAWLEKKFKRFGGIATISCRCKPAKDGKHKSWALISFWTELAALSASRDPQYDAGDGIFLTVKIDENPTKSRALAILQTQRKVSHRRRSTTHSVPPLPHVAKATSPRFGSVTKTIKAAISPTASAAAKPRKSTDHGASLQRDNKRHPDDRTPSPVPASFSLTSVAT